MLKALEEVAASEDGGRRRKKHSIWAVAGEVNGVYSTLRARALGASLIYEQSLNPCERIGLWQHHVHRSIFSSDTVG